MGGLTAAVLVALLWAALTSSSASAAVKHPYTGEFFGPGGVGSSETFQNVQGIGIDQTDGDVYVYDAGAARVYKFDQAGTPAAFSTNGQDFIEGIGGGGSPGEGGIAIAPAGSPGGTAGDIYVANNQTVKVYAPSGAELGQFGMGETCGVATDPSGHVFVGSYGDRIREYVPAANPPVDADQSATAEVSIGLCGVAADGLGQVFATQYGGIQSARFTSISDPTPVVREPGGQMAVDFGTNHLFRARGQRVEELDPTGTVISTFGQEGENLQGSHAVAVRTSTGRVYVGSEPGTVKIFGPGVVVPDVTAEEATEVGQKTAVLNGIVNADGIAVTACEFEYGPVGGPKTSVDCEQLVPTDEEDHAVSALATGLEPGRRYSVTLKASNANGTNTSNEVSFETIPIAATKLPTQVTATSATLNGVVSPLNQTVTECFFEYGLDSSYGSTVPCQGATPPDEESHPVSASISGLVRDATYHYRLVVKAGANEYTGEDVAFGAGGAHTEGETLGEVGATTAVLKAFINPRGTPTSYFIEYGTSTAYGASTAEVNLGEGESFNEVEELLSNLTPHTLYHWRIVTTDAFGSAAHPDNTFSTYLPPLAPETGCGNQSLRGGASALLPDCRAYEQATPGSAVEKNLTNAEGGGYGSTMYTSPSGDASIFYSVTGAADTEGSIQYPMYIAKREGGAWHSFGINPRAPESNEQLVLAYTRNLTGAYSLVAYPGPGRLVLQEAAGGTTIATGVDSRNTRIDAESQDGNVVMFEADAKLTPNANEEEEIRNVYVWNRTTGAITLVDVLEDGSTPIEGAFGGPWDWRNENPGQGGAVQGYYTENVLSRDGSRAFFTERETHQIYLRTDPAGENGSSVLISKSQKTNGSGPDGTDPNGIQRADFLEATPDGAYVFFKSHSELTNDANTGPFDQGEDLYRYTVATGKLVDLTPDPAEEEGARVMGVGAVSSDGSYAYFVARGNLAAGATDEALHLYAWHDGTTKFVGDVSSEDREIWGSGGSGPQGLRASPDGTSMIYTTAEKHPGYQNGGFQELYRYEYGTGESTCVSCNPTGNPAKDGVNLRGGSTKTIQPSVEQVLRSRNLSANGRRVIFETPEKLVAEDINQISDTYEWEAEGEGSCRSREQDGGCIFLLSTGTSPQPSYLAGASEDGKNVFFFTTQRLVGQDQDDLLDMYDSSVEGGLASQNPAAVVPCEGDACRGPGSAAAPPRAQGTATFAGPGNPKPKQPKKHKRHKHKKHGGKKYKKHGKKKNGKAKKGRNGGGHR